MPSEGGTGNEELLDKGYRLPVIRQLSSGYIMFSMITIINNMHYILESLQESKSSMFSSHTHNIYIYFYQIIILYTLNIYSIICQLCLSKDGGKLMQY